jgi:DNA-binding NtrC family response regulator
MPTLPTVNLEDLERLAIEQALRDCGGNKLAAAKRLQVGRTTLYRKLEEYRDQDAAAVKRPLRFAGALNSQNGTVIPS